MLIAVSALAVGCNNVEQGVGRSLGNANSVVNHESPKLWGKGQTPPAQRQRPGSPNTTSELPPAQTQ